MIPIHLSDLLQRKERVLDARPVKKWLSGKRVAITGCGFIGTEIARQVAAFEPATLTLLDNSERSLWEAGRAVPMATTHYADVRDRARLRHFLPTMDIVFHAAAMKHVPICERDEQEAIQTNIRGTQNVIETTRGHVVLVSTDKAVRPSSKMGCTKMQAEKICRESGRAAVVRFGNVIGSTGSVVPLFMDQIAAGGPVTVTDERMTRYFMTVSEAAELVLQSGALGPGVYVLDMGEPVNIAGLARDMIRLSGRRDIQVVYSGIRPGEKLHEELSSEGLEPSGVEGVWRVRE